MHLDLARSWRVGDIPNDVEAGRCAGGRSVLLDVGNETQWQLMPQRLAHHRAKDLFDTAVFILGNDMGENQTLRHDAAPVGHEVLS